MPADKLVTDSAGRPARLQLLLSQMAMECDGERYTYSIYI